MSQTVSKLHFTQAQPRWQDRLVQAWHQIGAAFQAAATRRQLAQLDDRALSDIGISRAQAQFTVEQPVWHLVPGNQR